MASAGIDESVKQSLKAIPLMKTKAGPRDGDLWIQRLKEEFEALITFISNNKMADTDWFRLESNSDGTKWYEFDVEFDIPVTYPTTAPEIALPELDGKTAKMYRGGKICLSDHFKPLWARNVPKFGIAQAFSLGLGPWLAAEIPDLVARGVIQPKSV
uniref:Ubiquitin-fold modifier-conjugating enzyme 1 n=1 Tax=Ascaris lumbricoides TaxID=6252 RepID=A0A9J2PUZ1_ASCLU